MGVEGNSKLKIVFDLIYLKEISEKKGLPLKRIRNSLLMTFIVDYTVCVLAVTEG